MLHQTKKGFNLFLVRFGQILSDFVGFGTMVPLVPGTWYLVPGTWHQVPGARCLVPDTWYQVLGTRYQVPGTKVPGTTQSWTNQWGTAAGGETLKIPTLISLGWVYAGWTT